MRRAIGAVGFVALLSGIVALVGLGFTNQTYHSSIGTLRATTEASTTACGKPMVAQKLSFATYADASGTNSAGQVVHPGGDPNWPSYGPTNIFAVKAHSCVTVTITQFDSGGALNNPYFDRIQGTVGNVATMVSNQPSVSGCPSGESFTYKGTYHQISPCDVGHTFTMRPLPGVDPGFFLSVPLPLAGNGNNECDLDSCPKVTVTFSFVSGPKGTYAWNCEFPCGLNVGNFGAVMSAYGYMSGYLHVV